MKSNVTNRKLSWISASALGLLLSSVQGVQAAGSNEYEPIEALRALEEGDDDDNDNDPSSRPHFTPGRATRNLATAAVGTALQYTLVHPIWTQKVRTQSGLAPLPWRLSHLHELYRGYGVHVGRALPVAYIQIGVGNLLTDIGNVQGSQSLELAAGFLGGVASAPLVNATDAIMMRQKLQKGSALQTTSQLFAQRGFAAFLHGTTATALRNGGRAASYFTIFPKVNGSTEQWLASTKPELSEASRVVFANLTATTIAGLFATIATNPPDMIKTIQQKEILVVKNEAAKRSLFAVAQSIVAKDGPSALFKGLAHRIVSRNIEVFVMGQAMIQVPKVIDAICGPADQED